MHPDILRQLAAEHTRDLITEAGAAGTAREARHTQRRRLAAHLRRSTRLAAQQPGPRRGSKIPVTPTADGRGKGVLVVLTKNPTAQHIRERNSLTMTRDAVTSDQLPPSGLPFSVAVRGGGLLFLSGQVAQEPATGELVDGDVAQEADQILHNIAATLAAIGKDLDDVIRVGVYLTDMSQFGAMNEAYRRHFAEPYPARTAIGVAALPLGAAVEMDVVVG
jgi:2-iminobutanoate/2-iminopropanoate deaminase